MVIEQDYLFWRLIHEFVVKQDFRMIRISEDGYEVWLEPIKKKKYQIIRLNRYDIDWGNRLARDIEYTGNLFSQIRKQSRVNSLHLLNVYVSSYPPVDDVPTQLLNEYNIDKTTISSLLIEKGNLDESIGELEQKLSISLQPITGHHENIDYETVQRLKHEVLTYSNNRRKQEKEVFEHSKPFFTYIFIAIQVLMFLLLELNGGSTNDKTLIQFGAKYNPAIVDGEWWRLFTPMVLHIGFLHLLMNTIALFYLGSTVERIYGKFRFLFIYIIAGLAGSICSFAFNTSLSAGASGAIFGCFGALLYFGIVHRTLFFRTMGSNIIIVIGINLAFGFLVPGVDNNAHIGGLLGGFLAAIIVQLPKQKRFLIRAISLIVTAGLLVCLYLYGVKESREVAAIVKGQQLIEARQYEEAYKTLSKAEKEKRDSADLLFLLSVAELNLGLMEDAEDHLLNVIKLEPDYDPAFYNLSVLYEVQGNKEKALQFVNKALEKNPDNKQYKEFKHSIME